MTVLIVDDDAAVRRAHRKILERAGFEVDVVESGVAAFERVGHTTYDAILCDIHMPDLQGSNFYEQLEEQAPDTAGRIIFVTGLADDDEIHAFLKSTGQPFLGKPAEPEDLIHAIEVLAERRRSGAFARISGGQRRPPEPK